MPKVLPHSRHPLADLWLRIIFAEGPLDRVQAEESVRAIYRIVGEPEPRHWLWLETPVEAANSVSWILTESNLTLSPGLRDYWTDLLR
jgi:hypothetical protein